MSEAKDSDDPLADEPFSWKASKDGKVFISYQGRRVMILKGGDAARFLKRVDSADAPAAQMVMAKVTGNFKRGNERRGDG